MSCVISLAQYIGEKELERPFSGKKTYTEKTVFCCHKCFVTNGLSVPAEGYINTVKHYGIAYKADFQSNYLNTYTMTTFQVTGQLVVSFTIHGVAFVHGDACIINRNTKNTKKLF